MPESEGEALLKELRSIKMLMVMYLVGQGYKQKQLATILGVSEATMSRMMPKVAAAKKVKSEEPHVEHSGK